MMEEGDQREAGEPGDDGGVGLDPQAVDRPAAGPAENPLVDNLLAVQLFAQLLHLLLHFEEGFIGRFHVTASF